MTIPIIDLFAGPGGLGEGFSALRAKDGGKPFELAVSIEKDGSAFQTLMLRAVYRRLIGTSAFQHYVDYVTGVISKEAFVNIPRVAAAFDHARVEVKQFELGVTPETLVDQEIRRGLNGAPDWVLIGGPPCQAYSLAGRSRRANDISFAKDVKHFLYREYLRIIRKHRPAVFVMENVKGLLSSRHSGQPVFSRILEDFSAAFDGCSYNVLSFVNRDQGFGLVPNDYLIEAERYGVPQTRHRVILLGIRGDLEFDEIPLLTEREEVTVGDALHDLPPIRSRLSGSNDSAKEWQRCLKEAVGLVKGHVQPRVLRCMNEAARHATAHVAAGAPFISKAAARSEAYGPKYIAPARRKVSEYREWIDRPDIGGYLQHETRTHMAPDLARYLFASSFALEFESSPRIRDYPSILLPEHKNIGLADGPAPFQDRFRVQCVGSASTTVVSHIAKDGHYYIHYDPTQCRSLTVREAARLQTFPDDYYFEGNRTQQYGQVGNAVPPLLANKVASIVHSVLVGADQGKTKTPLRLVA